MTDADQQGTLSPVKCPKCGHEELVAMPQNACLWLHECKGCGALLRPKQGDCCVFCSYGQGCPPELRDRPTA